MSQSKKKVKLDLDAIEVETFVTNDQQSARGTVFGYASEVGAQTCAMCGYTAYDACTNNSCNEACAYTAYAGCAGDTSACGGGSAICQTIMGVNCSLNTCAYTCNCANESVVGYASCGTTCQATACVGGCDSQACYTSACGTSTCGCGGGDTGVNTCQAY